MATRGKGPPSDGVMKAPNTQTDLDQTQITPAAAAPTAENTQSPQTDPVLKVPPRKRVSPSGRCYVPAQSLEVQR